LLQWRIVIEHESRLTMVFPGSIILYHADVAYYGKHHCRGVTP